ncbi:MAG: PKD domain-containing protein [Candidatus Thermoplasmatota archaeon]|nr:PKD domain-containing protein [Candidatus Thermoplasmatota archaeon]
MVNLGLPMRKIQVLAATFTVVMMCFGGCLDDSEDGETNRAPEALILMPRQASVMEAGEPFQIDGSASTDPDGDELQYMWTLSGLGSPTDLSTKMSDLVTVDTPGNDLVLTLMVRDPGGLTSQDIVVISVEPGNRPPIATITTPSNGGAYSEGKEVAFNGMASSDPDNDILSYNWDLGDADGPTYPASKQSKFEMELDEGDYRVTLTVEDPDGESSSVTHSFSVTNLPPIASIEVDTNSVFTGESIQFSGEDSYDPEGGALDYLWDFGDNQTSSLKSPQHSWGQTGTYNVKLTVEDGNGQEGSATKSIEIKSLGPTAEFVFKDSGSEVEKVRANSNITLDASDSSGPDGEIKEYKWDFGDGIERTTNESSTEYSWSSGGYYNVTLVAVDENDETGTITRILQVVPEDYVDEGQDGTLVVQNSDENYNLDVEIFVSSVEIEFSEIGCVGVGGLDYSITVQDSSGNEIGSNQGSIGCGGETTSWDTAFYDNEGNGIELGEYQVTITFTNNGTPVQANWDYRLAINYNF